jgi:hypothetical protein
MVKYELCAAGGHHNTVRYTYGLILDLEQYKHDDKAKQPQTWSV